MATEPVSGTGVITTWPVQAGHRGGLLLVATSRPARFDERAGVIAQLRAASSRVTPREDESALSPACTRPAKRGPRPAGLIGSTKSDAQQTITRASWRMPLGGACASTAEVGHEVHGGPPGSRGVEFTTRLGALDAYERPWAESTGELPGSRAAHEHQGRPVVR